MGLCHIIKSKQRLQRLINRNFKNMDERTFVLLYKSMVRPHVEYGNTVWCPYKIIDIKQVEKIQMRATKMARRIRKKSYAE